MSRHVSAEILSLYRDGAVSSRKATRIRVHLSGCSLCSAADADLTDISTALAGTQFPPMPDALAERIQLAIAAEATGRAALLAAGGADAPADATGTAADPGAAAIPGSAREHASAGEPAGAGGGPGHIPGRPDLPQRSARRARRFRLPDLTSPLVLRGMTAAAAVVILAGAGFLLARGQAGPESAPATGTGSGTASHSSLKAPAATPLAQQHRLSVQYHLNGKIATTSALITRNANFTRRSLAAKLRHNLASTTSLAPQATVTALPSRSGTNAGATFGVNVPQLGGCLSQVDAGRKVLLATIAQFLGHPATIIVLRSLTSAAVLDVVIVKVTCSSSSPGVIFRSTIPAS